MIWFLSFNICFTVYYGAENIYLRKINGLKKYIYNTYLAVLFNILIMVGLENEYSIFKLLATNIKYLAFLCRNVNALTKRETTLFN